MIMPSQNSNQALILSLPPEIFPIFSSHIALQHIPATLSALALTCTQINRYVTWILYSKVTFRHEEHAHGILDRILKDKKLGLLVRELHILMDHEAFGLDKKKKKKNSKETTLLDKLHYVVKEKLIPQLIRFSLMLFEKKSDVYTAKTVKHLTNVPREFWSDLQDFCPNLRGAFYHRCENKVEDSWVLYEVKNRSPLEEDVIKFPDPKLSSYTLIHDLANSLQSFRLSFKNRHRLSIDSLLSMTFPHLESLALSHGVLDKTSNAMDFWRRHPSLERLSIDNFDGRWFSDNVAGGLLPRLTHLKGTFDDIRALASHLGQLQHLSITDSLNCQVPYLLRSVIPGGLPHLKSLEIDQESTTYMSVEGTSWYEKVDGQIIEHSRNGESVRTMPVGYIHSIVRGAPNIEELCLHGYRPIFTRHIRAIARHIAQFRCLERFYFRAFHDWQQRISQGDILSFLSVCRVIGTSCKTVRLVTDVSSTESCQYLIGRIIRDSDGEVTDVALGRGFGMEFTGGNENPFPYNPPPITF